MGRRTPRPKGGLHRKTETAVLGRDRIAQRTREVEGCATQKVDGGQGAASAQSRGESRVGLGTRGDGSEVQGANENGDNTEGEVTGLMWIVIHDQPTAEMLFPAGRKTSEDYHTSMTVMFS